MKKYFDISVPIRNGMVHWPGDPDVNIYSIGSIAAGDGVNISGINFGLHTGTHMDAPSHFIDNALDISEVPPDLVIGKVRIVEIKDPNVIRKEELKTKEIEGEDRILFKTKNSLREWFKEDFKKDYVYLSEEGAEYLESLNVKLIGIDYLSIGEFKAGRNTHKILLQKNIWIIEGLYLKDIAEGLYEIFALPLKILGADGSPVRVILKEI